MASVPDWVREFYAGVDSADLSVYERFFADDVALRFASSPPQQGREAVVGALAEAHNTLDLAHTVTNAWQSDEHVLVEASVDYRLKATGATATLPALTVFHRSGDRVDEMRVYVDLGPLFGGGEH